MVKFEFGRKQCVTKKRFEKILSKMNDDGVVFYSVAVIYLLSDRNVMRVLVYASEHEGVDYSKYGLECVIIGDGDLAKEQREYESRGCFYKMFYSYDDMVAEFKNIKLNVTIFLKAFFIYVWRVLMVVPMFATYTLANLFICLFYFDFSNFNHLQFTVHEE